MPNILDALRAMDESSVDRAPATTKGSISPASALVAALDEEALVTNLTKRDEDVTVATLRGCVKRLRDAEKKLERTSSKKKAKQSAALSEVTNSKTQDGGSEAQQHCTAAAKKRQQMMSAKKSGTKGIKFFKGRDNAHQAASREAKSLDLVPHTEFEARFSTQQHLPATGASGAAVNSQFAIHRNNSKLCARRRLSEGLH